MSTAKVGPVERLRYVRENLVVKRDANVARDLMEMFGISKAQAWRDIKEVRKEWGEQEKERSPYIRAEMIERLLELHEKAMRDADYKSASSALREVCKITGLEERTVRTIIGADDGVKHLVEALALTPAQRAARIAELEAKANVEPEGPSYEVLMSIARKAAELCVGDSDDPGVDELRGLLRKAGLGLDE